jgi:hypothetical protein
VSFPDPEVGLVIRYAYLWRDEAVRGREEGVKDRPCLIVLAMKTSDGASQVVVVPITHSPPEPATKAVEIPAATARRLGFDTARSWIITREMNSFVWPGPDLRPAQVGKPGEGPAFGFVPKSLARKVLDAVREHRREGLLTITDREEEDSATSGAKKSP